MAFNIQSDFSISNFLHEIGSANYGTLVKSLFENRIFLDLLQECFLFEGTLVKSEFKIFFVVVDGNFDTDETQEVELSSLKNCTHCCA